MKKKVSIVLMVLVVLGSVMFASGSKESAGNAQEKKVSINFWYSANESNPNDIWGVWNRENIELFQKANPNVTIEPTVISDEMQYRTKISTEMAAGNTPDVLQTWFWGRLEPFASSGRLMELDDVLLSSPALAEVLPETSRVPGRFQGKLYALPGIS
ncbi:MAG: extracellular solute-binding protein, partial [Clostridia bacterium]|nr:extracellular solute-binding protein [Clostridia bacterium]